ncbi:MAG: DUF1080 domain-containing protein [Lacibacter sp.]|nr:DUF1080 domain-containing protein [Lacibacter sp.]
MMRSLLMIAAVGLLASCNNEGEATNANDTSTAELPAPVPPLLSEDEVKEGWVSLFDGKSTKGWHKYGGAPVGNAWKVADGTLYLDTSVKQNGKIVDGGDILTDEEYENFHLKIEWKISPNGNSGVIFFSHEDTTKFKHPYESGPEMQVLDNNGHPDAKIIKHRAGDLYDLITSSPETVKPVGEWNLAEIIAKDGQLEFHLNGTKVVSTTMWDDNWTNMIAASKFKQWPGFGTFKKGRLVLQDHENAVWFRNIKIKKL